MSRLSKPRVDTAGCVPTRFSFYVPPSTYRAPQDSFHLPLSTFRAPQALLNT